MRKQFLTRIRILVGCIILGALLISARLYFLQVVHGESYRTEANSQYVRSARDIFDRGSILFTQRDGTHIAAASLKTGYLLAIQPDQIENPDLLYEALRPHITLDRETFLSRARKEHDPYEEIERHISPEGAKLIEDKKLDGVQLFREYWRYYPGGSLASHALGFVGFGDNGYVQTGQYGIERYWESVLTRDSDTLYVNFFAEVFANARKVIHDDKRSRAGDVVTSIEPSVQQTLERVLFETQEAWNAKHIGGIVINPKTGAIYAMGALPNFNPNAYSDVEDVQVFGNPFVESVYEMGSIIKPIALSIGLDVGAVTAETTYKDTGSIDIDTYTISNYDGRARGVVNMQEVLNQSLNLGMVFVAEEVGGEVLGERMKAFGFGTETGIDVPFEVRGLIDNLDSPRKVEYATAAFGQGIALTPIATVRALTALGNGGYLVTPHFVTTLHYDSGGEANVAPENKVTVLKEETSKEITRMLVEVVDSALRGGTVKKDRYSIAAKTGTAQIAKEGERGYYEDRFLHSFFGYFPAYDPEFLIFLYHVEPQGARYASETLTTPFMDMVDFLINYYSIPPDR
jgi:cell division protein FtsI/penicillin-binding protein 2